MKSQNSIMPENYEEFISLTLRTRNSKKPSRILARNWKHQWLLLCLVKIMKNCGSGSRFSERTLHVLPSTALESPGKTRHESQNVLLSSRTEQHHRTGRPVVDAYSSSYSEWNVDKTWSSQEWKSDELMEDRTGRPVVIAQHTDSFIVENDKMNSGHRSKSERSLTSRNSCTGCLTSATMVEPFLTRNERNHLSVICLTCHFSLPLQASKRCRRTLRQICR